MAKKKKLVQVMSRKILRNKFRREAEQLGVKSSRYVGRMFDRYQIKKYGETVRTINQAKGTQPRRKWRLRIESALEV